MYRKKKSKPKTGDAESEKNYIDELKKEIDAFKFQIDDLCENEIPLLSATSPDRDNAYKRASGLKQELSSLNQKLDGISVADTKLSSKVFESKKGAEKSRLVKLQEKLDNISEQLEPDEVEEAYFRNLISDDDISKSEQLGRPLVNNMKNEVEVDDETEVEEDEEDVSEDESEDDIVHAEALTTYNAEQEGDLSFEKGEHLKILEQSEDGWWYARNDDDEEGVVPSTFIKIVDAPGAEKPQPDKPAEEEISRSGKQLWNIFKEKKTTSQEDAVSDSAGKIILERSSRSALDTSINEVLKALKAMPSGFRSSTLGNWYQKGTFVIPLVEKCIIKNLVEDYRCATWVIPKLNPSKLQFRDLHWDNVNKNLREFPVATCRTFSLVSVRCVPQIGVGVEVLSRHVYISLWDEKKIISNIHRVRAVPLDRDMNWSFTPKIGKNIPSLYNGDFVARINSDHTHKNLSILFEFNYTYKRTSTGQQGDISCGWATLALYDLDGTPVANKNYELSINGGTPFERDVPLDPTANISGGTLMQSLIRSNQQPRMTVKTTSFNRVQKEIFDKLPATLVTCVQHALFIGYYRQHAALTFCRDENIPSHNFCDPLLSYFPRTLSFPDLMDALKNVYDEKLKGLNRTQKKDPVILLKTFKQSFTESAFGLMQCANIPPFVWADEAAEKARSTFIQTFLLHKDPLGNLLNPEYRHKPFFINKLTFTVLSKHCVEPPPLDQSCLITT